MGLRSITKIEIAIPADKCAYRTEGDVTGTDAKPLGGILVQAIADHDDESTWITGYTAAAGTFALEVPDPGDYRVSVELNASRPFYQHGGIVLEEDRASLVSIVDSNASGLRIQLSEGVSELQLSGVLIDAVGVPLEDVNVVPIAWIMAFSEDAEAADYAGSDGRFRLRIPTDGSHRLLSYVDGCEIYRGSGRLTTKWEEASTLRISGNDLTDVTFRLPTDPSRLCA